MKLTQLSDEELNEYRTSDSLENGILKKYMLKIESTKKTLKETEKQLDGITNMICSGQFQFFGIECLNVIQKLNKCTNNINAIIRNTGIKREIQQEIMSADLYFEQLDNNIIRIIFSELLPDRMNTDDKGFATNLWRQQEKYKNAILKYFTGSECQLYDEKVVLCFIHHFYKEREARGTIKDHDNFEVKSIIDCIANCIFVDDSAKYCSHYMDYQLDAEEEEYSEIYIVPQSHFNQWFRTLHKTV